MSELVFAIFVIGLETMLLAAGTAWACQGWWPRMPLRRLVVRASFVQPLLFGTIGVVGISVLLNETCPTDPNCDGPAHAAVGVLYGCAIAIVSSMTVGLATLHYTLRLLRGA